MNIWKRNAVSLFIPRANFLDSHFATPLTFCGMRSKSHKMQLVGSTDRTSSIHVGIVY